MVLAVTLCPYCAGLSQQCHPRCDRCTILIGPGHEEMAGKWINGRFLCTECQRIRGTRRPTIGEVVRGLDGLFEYWRAGATVEDVANSYISLAEPDCPYKGRRGRKRA